MDNIDNLLKRLVDKRFHVCALHKYHKLLLGVRSQQVMKKDGTLNEEQTGFT